MEYIELHLTDHCNLNCIGCSHFSNISKPYFKSLEEYMSELEELKKLNIHMIRLMGGEPLLHPNWRGFVGATRYYFPESEIVLVTNGLLLNDLSGEDIDELNRLDITVCMSSYGLNLNNPAYYRLKSQVHSKGVLYNISLDLNGLQNKEMAFENCDLHKHHWYFYKDYKIYPCCIMPNIHILMEHFNLNLPLVDIGVDIREHDEAEIEEILNRPTEMCRFCNTIARQNSKVSWCKSKGELEEWTV